jgi:predicted NAD/FAD-binding protein
VAILVLPTNFGYPEQEAPLKPSVAVIGSGVSGLVAAYVMRHEYEVTLFERDDRLGGHAHTHSVDSPEGMIRVDSGFIVHNRRTYPTLLRIFEELKIETQPTEMSMSIRCDGCGLTYAGGRGAKGILAQPWRVLDPRFVRMLIEVPKFHRAAQRLLEDESSQEMTWGEFLKRGKYSQYFIRHFAVPLVSCVWSSGDDTAVEYPAKYLFAFLRNHGMLSVGGSPAWRTVTGGSATYVAEIAKLIPHIHLGTGIKQVKRFDDRIELTTDKGETKKFDYVVIATHANAALSMLIDASDAERTDLSSITYSPNDTWLHTDESIMPRVEAAKASWNYRIPTCDASVESVQVTYWMNKLQSLPTSKQLLVTLNPAGEVDPNAMIARMAYEHPVFTQAGIAAASRLRNAGGPRLAFAGAHFGWGFHEDGAKSGLDAALKLGAKW